MNLRHLDITHWLDAVIALFHERGGSHRANNDLLAVARAATFGAVEFLLVAIYDVMPGTVDETDGAAAAAILRYPV